MKLENLKEQKEKEYNRKLDNLKQAIELVNRLKVECVNLEGQLAILKELTNKDKKNVRSS